ncbi:MAG: ABC transporter ATP-binding protein [Proteobacteria bacterium]|nr:ABC transporter ATP-binding protein [Pseudomonadota bacterium]MBU1742362.1 ABC transporter ATP-binding protein [Pseudomonadota bacterium]
MLEVRDIHTYYGRSHVIQGLSLQVKEGEVVCLLGRNGAGKTTTIRSIMGYLTPKQGSITFRDKSILGTPPHRVCRTGISYVPQGKSVFAELSVEDNLRVVRREAEGGWTVDRVYELFPKLEALRRRKAGHLSGGERQMLAIGRALMTNPQLLLLDEPTEGLAPLIVKAVGQFISRLAETGLPVLLAEQNVKFAVEVARRGYIIDKGRVHIQGDIRELSQDTEIIGKYLAV